MMKMNQVHLRLLYSDCFCFHFSSLGLHLRPPRRQHARKERLDDRCECRNASALISRRWAFICARPVDSTPAWGGSTIVTSAGLLLLSSLGTVSSCARAPTPARPQGPARRTGRVQECFCFHFTSLGLHLRAPRRQHARMERLDDRYECRSACFTYAYN